MDWIRLEAELPVHNRIVLACDSINQVISIGKYDVEEDCFALMNMENLPEDSNVTHWMPLPNMPD